MKDSNEPRKTHQKRQGNFEQAVKDQADRKMTARKEGDRTIWYGLGMFGIVGWSVAIPTLIGIAVGVWLDIKLNDPYSWTLMMLFLGVIIGCLNAWYWIQRESQDE
ncbi:AtpZ/AtpI family protein [Cyanothece sp. BG0011]|uniref:AtpZ/AtpI family protein n=1 Tax=Cyanothece sp. BG0011 TaxID=2082950 RepID=UPI000D1F730A|nr:AtpZ/AtpI family protein [Cyanothece sp. BG0011]